MTRRERDIKLMIEKAGLSLIALSFTGRDHYKATVKTPNGEKSIIFSKTPSENRGELNKQAMLRRLANGQEGKHG